MKCLSSLSLYHLPPIDIPPLPPKFLSCNTLSPTSISPAKNLSKYAVTSFPPIDIPPTIKEIQKLNFVRTSATSVLPRPVYHPAVINASQAFFLKHPSRLTAEEMQKFKQYQEDKTTIGEPLETEAKFLPNGGIRTCLNCGELM